MKQVATPRAAISAAIPREQMDSHLPRGPRAASKPTQEPVASFRALLQRPTGLDHRLAPGPPKPQVADDIESFFRFFRHRVQNVRTLCPPADSQGPMEPDFHVLVSAGLDSLALYWAKTFSPRLVNDKLGALRMGESLLQHGNSSIFAKCSAPNLLDRVTSQGMTALFPFIGKYLHNEGPLGTVRTWQHDPDLTQVAPDLLHVGVKGVNATWVQRSRYGELLFREYRCMWLHQFQPSERLASNYAPDESEPRYQNLLVPDDVGTDFERRQLPMFPRAFMLTTYQTVVAQFESECIAKKTAPVVE